MNQKDNYKIKYKFIPLYEMMKYMGQGKKLKLPINFAQKYILVFGNKNKLEKKELEIRDKIIDSLIKKYKLKREKKYKISLYLMAFNPETI